MSSADPSSSDPIPIDRDAQLDSILDEILNRSRKGERYSISQWQSYYPEWADELNEFLPTILLAERLDSNAAQMESGEATVRPLGVTERLDGLGPPSEDEQYPRVLGDYELQEVLGRGGMGVVFTAHQGSLDRTVAVKVLARHLAGNPKLVERFHREAHSAARLHHKNIVPVFDHGTTDGVSWYAMQRIEGESLNDTVARLREAKSSDRNNNIQVEPLERGPGTVSAPIANDQEQSPLSDFKRLAQLARDVAYALEYAHQHGVIHRDIKPANLILDRSGNIWISDFGLARIDSESQLTQAGDVVGTFRYVAPEQLDGVSAPSCDIYSLGVTLYELATLRPAWSSGVQGKILEQVRRETVSSPRAWNPEIPRDLETIILKAMARESQDRYATALALADDLDRFCQDLPIRARVPSTGEHLLRWSRKNKIAATAWILLALLIGLVIPAILLSYNLMLKAEIRRVSSAESATLKANRENQRRLIESRILQARAIRRSATISARQEALTAVQQGIAEIRSLASPRETTTLLENQLLTEAIAALALPHLEHEQLLAIQQTGLESPIVLDIAAEHVVLMGFDRQGYQTRVLPFNKPQQPVWQINQHSHFARLIASGNAIVLSSDITSPRQVEVWDIRTNQLLWKNSLGSSHWKSEAFAISAGARFVVAVDSNGRMVRYDVAQMTVDLGGKLPDRPMALRLQTNPEATMVALIYADRIEVREFATGRVVRLVSQPRQGIEISRGFWSPDDRWFSAKMSDGTVAIYELPEWNIVRSFMTDPAGGSLLDASLDGRFLSTTSWSRRIKLWDVLTGESIASVTAPMEIHSLNLSQNRLGPIVDSEQVSAYQHHPSSIFKSYGLTPNPLVRPYQLALSNDGTVMVIDSESEGLYFLDLAHQRHHWTPLKYNFPMFDQKGNLWAIRDGTIYRWPVLSTLSSGGQLRFDSRQTVLHSRSNCFSVGPLCKTLAWTTESGGVAVADLGHTPLRPRVLKNQGDVRFVLVSPDEQWVAAPGWHEPACYVFEVATGRQWNLAPGFTGCYPSFSPDGSRMVLAIAGKEIRIYQTGQWERPMRIIKATDGLPSFSPDGTLLAVGITPGSISLFNLLQDSEPLQLILPTELRVRNILFSQDGSQLYFNSNDSQCIYRWNFGSLHQQLKDLGVEPGLISRFQATRPIDASSVDEQPTVIATAPKTTDLETPHVGRRPPNQRAESDRVTPAMDRLRDDWVVFESNEAMIVQLEASLDRAFERGDRPELIDVLTQLVRLKPDDAWHHNNLAWYLVEKPGSPQMELTQALEQIRVALAAEPDNPYFLNTLGVVQYRSGEFMEAQSALTRAKSLQASAAETIEDEYFLSMTFSKRGQRTRGLQALLRGLLFQLQNDPRNRDRWNFAEEAAFTLARSLFKKNAK